MSGSETQKPIEATNLKPKDEVSKPVGQEDVDAQSADAQAAMDALLGGGASACDAVRGCNKEIVQSSWEQKSRDATDSIARNPQLAVSFAKLLQAYVATTPEPPPYFRVSNQPWSDFNNAMSYVSGDRSESVAKQVWGGVLKLAQTKDPKAYAKLQSIAGTV
ncbi:MAG: hypothetical protein WCT53_04790 [Candidatus Gracilibacteria bacterium]